MKSFTDLEQSKKLAEFLPLESADMCYQKVHAKQEYFDIAINVPPENQNDLPCWSLPALLSALPSVIERKGKRMFLTLEKAGAYNYKAGAYNLYYRSPDRLNELWETKEESIDACVAMILKLHELKML